MDRRFGGGGGREKGKLVAPKRERGKLGGAKEKRGQTGKPFGDPFPLGNLTAPTPARTMRNDFPVEHPPTSDHLYLFALIKETIQSRHGHKNMQVRTWTLAFVVTVWHYPALFGM